MLRGNKVIARIEIPIVFNDRHIPAGGPKNTQRMVLSVGWPCGLFEHLHDDTSDVLPYPLIKDGTEKCAKRLSRHRARAHTTSRSWLPLDERNKAEVLGFDLLKKAVHLEGILDILRVHHAQEIDRDFVLAQQAIALHHLLVGRLLALGYAVRVVQCLRTVEAKPDGKIFCRKKAAPVIVEEHTIRLYAVGDASVRGLMLALEFDNLVKIVQPENSRLTAVPKEIDHGLRGNLDLLDDVLLQQVIGHTKCLGLRIEQLL